MKRLAVLASHGGTTLQAVMDACNDGSLAACVCLVVSNNSNSGAIQRAQGAGIPICHISTMTHPHAEEQDAAMLAALQAAEADWVLLLGYMKKLGPKTLRTFNGRVLNTHPALLPKYGGQGFFGRKVHEAVIAAGDTQSGATVHLVDEEYDSGRIMAQVPVPVMANDTPLCLEERVKSAEKKLLLDTLRQLEA